MADTRFAYQRLEVFQVARQALALTIEHRGCWQGLPGEIASQLSRAMVSVVCNIAEGAGRFTPADQRRYYQIACGSATEVMACVEIASLHGRVSDELYEAMASRLHRVVQMLLALIRKR